MIHLRHVATIAAALALAGCESLPSMPPMENPFRPPPLAARVTEGEASAPIVLARGQTLVVALEANLTTGFRWEALPGYAPTLAALGTPDYTGRGAYPMIGAPGDMTFRFRADSARQDHARARLPAPVRAECRAGEDRSIRRDGAVARYPRSPAR